MQDLIERLEKATEPDRRIDASIWMLEPCELPDCLPDVKRRIYDRFMRGQQWGDTEVPAYTASIDAALTLVPDGVVCAIGRDADGKWAGECGDYAIDGANAAIALSAAALIYRMEEMRDHSMRTNPNDSNATPDKAGDRAEVREDDKR